MSSEGFTRAKGGGGPIGDDPRRCTATTKRTGTRCEKWAMENQRVCAKHGGKAPQAIAAGKRRKQEAIVSREVARIAAASGEDIDPGQHLLNSLALAWGWVKYWGAMCSQLDEATMRELGPDAVRGDLAYREPEDELDVLAVNSNDRLLGFDRHGQASLHPYVVAFAEAKRDHAKVADLCHRAGLGERRVKLAEVQGQLIVNVIRGLAMELERLLGVQIVSRPEFPQLVRRHLALASGS